MSNYTIGILGLGVFGTTIAKTLHKYNCNIVAIDNHEQQINQLESILTRGVVGDITDRTLLRAAGIENCDVVVVATGENLESSVLGVMHSKILGVPKVIAKVKGTTAKEILLRVGADKVISPERETGISLAKHLIHKDTVNLFELEGNASIVEFRPPVKWIGKTLAELKLRQNYKMNIIGYRCGENQELNIQLTPNYVFKKEEIIMAVTDHNTLDHFEEVTN
ncbi:TrkA family potassium uptake protein [Streptococcus suis]|nr:TrkA family potassium uptake protein [Streptococcus suis]